MQWIDKLSIHATFPILSEHVWKTGIDSHVLIQTIYHIIPFAYFSAFLAMD